MKLKYKILWVENDSDWAESIEEEIKELVEQQYGFYYERTFSSKQNEAIMFNAYDLILMDLNLESEPTGDVLIKNIRDREIYTDVIFYSADGLQKIKQKAHDLDLEGVYFASRNKDLFINKVNSIIKTTIHKVQDLNNLRGLVMAEVSELDAMMDNIIQSYFSTEERIMMFHKHITANREKSLQKSLSCDKKCQLAWRSKNIQEIVPQLDSSQKARAIKIILEQSRPELYSGSNFYEEYVAAIITSRNELAHCKSEIRDGKEILVTRNGDKCFDDNFFKTIRQDILKYSNIFKELLK